jgi:hypothetical protein
MRIFTKVNGELVVYGTDATLDNVHLAIEEIRRELGAGHKSPVLVLVKY